MERMKEKEKVEKRECSGERGRRMRREDIVGRERRKCVCKG